MQNGVNVNGVMCNCKIHVKVRLSSINLCSSQIGYKGENVGAGGCTYFKEE